MTADEESELAWTIHLPDEQKIKPPEGGWKEWRLVTTHFAGANSEYRLCAVWRRLTDQDRRRRQRFREAIGNR